MPAGGTADHWDFTLLPFGCIITRLLDAVAPATIVEVGSDRGDFTRELLDWAGPRDAKVVAIDPEPAGELFELARARAELDLVRRPSPEALGEVPQAEAIILDGDHNYYTVTEELRLIEERSEGSGLPLLLLHDVGWPHARRDTYYSPGRIPEEHRQPLAHDVMVAPGEPGTVSTGIGFRWAAKREGGPRNGVLTAVEDFLDRRVGIRLRVVPAFFGLAVLWPERAPWDAAVTDVMEPWGSSPLLERLEEIRLAQIVERKRMDREEETLRAMLNSRAFAIAERIARIRASGSPSLSRERVRRALED
jgi:hypothetical protein